MFHKILLIFSHNSIFGYLWCFYLGSLPLLRTFICFVCVLRLANTGFVLRFPFAHVCLSVCFASQTPDLCCAVSSLPYNLFAFMLCLYFTIDFVLRISPCKLRVCLGQSQSFYLALFSEVFCYANFVSQISLLSSAIPSTPILNFIAYVFNVFFVRVSSPELRFVEFSSVPRFQVLILHALDFVAS